MEKMSLERTTKKIFVGEMEGKRLRGRPRLKWTENFKIIIQLCILLINLTYHYITVFAFYYILYLGMTSSIRETSIEE